MPKATRSATNTRAALYNRNPNSHSRTQDYKYSGCTISDPAVEYQLNIDAMSNTHSLPKITKGLYYISGSQTHIISYLKTPFKQIKPKKVIVNRDLHRPPNPFQEIHLDIDSQIHLEEEPQVESSQGAQIKEAEIVAVGAKTCDTKQWYFVLTVLFGCCLILPFLLLCCICWKKRFFPKYEIDAQLYKLIGVFLRKVPSCRALSLVVVDNAFNGEKAQLLYQSLKEFDLSHFSFKNLALPCNYHETEADNFIANMQVVKSVASTTVLKWGDMIV